MALTYQLRDLVGAIEAAGDPVQEAALLCELARVAIETMRLKPLPSEHPRLIPAVANLKRAADGAVSYFASLEQEIREIFPAGVRDAFASLEARIAELAGAVEVQQTELLELRQRREELERMEWIWNQVNADGATAEAAIARLEKLKQEAESLTVTDGCLRATDAMASTLGTTADRAREAVSVMAACATDYRLAIEANKQVADFLMQTASLIALPTPIPEGEIQMASRGCSEAKAGLVAVDRTLTEIDSSLSRVLAFHREALKALHSARGGL